jgi:hypothetical protein
MPASWTLQASFDIKTGLRDTPDLEQKLENRRALLEAAVAAPPKSSSRKISAFAFSVAQQMQDDEARVLAPELTRVGGEDIYRLATRSYAGPADLRKLQERGQLAKTINFVHQPNWVAYWNAIGAQTGSIADKSKQSIADNHVDEKRALP